MHRPGWDRERRAATHARCPARLRLMAGALGVCLALSPPALAHEAIDRQIADLGALIATDPREPSLYLRRGELHRAHGDWHAAARDYRRARRLDPTLEAVDLCFGRLHLDAGRPARAIVNLDRFLRRQPEHPEALTIGARALTRLGRNLDAARAFTRAIEAHRPDHADPDLFLERAQALAGAPEPRLEDALRGLEEGLRMLGPVVGLGLYAIDLEVRLGRIDPALERLDRLAAQSPRKESYLARRASILEAAERRDEARRAYEETLAAIASLPAERRAARAVLDLESTARSGLERLALTGGAAGPQRPPGIR